MSSGEELWFEVADNEYEKDFKAGDVVKRFKESKKLDYPCIILTCDNLELFRASALKSIIESKSLLDEPDTYNVYIGVKSLNSMQLIGVVKNTRLKHLLSNKIFDVFDKRVYLDERTKIEGDLMYALCVTADD